MTSNSEPVASPTTDSDLQKHTITYNDEVVRNFVVASVAWGIVGMLVGALIALQLAFHRANVHPMLSFGRLRPLHTNAVIFAFVGNMVFAGIYHSTQRLLKARLASDWLSKIHFWGWQAIIVAAAITLPLGITQGKEYAELEWPIDLAITVVWVLFAINFFWTLVNRTEKHLYVAVWFYIATIVTVAILHIVNSLAIPISLSKSYSAYGGAQDALVQWWYGHNAVAFFLTTPILGIMYYYLPKAANRPVYSYRLSIIHFWALIFMYIWAGPHHLLYTALPEWAQTLGMVFSVMLWAPSWGGMLNGLLTLRGAWQKVRTDPVLKFFAAGITFYGMATFEGPLLSIRSVSSLAHYTDWIIGHVHSAALGWNGFMAAGMFYWLIPALYGRKLHSTKLADLHFWIGTTGILLYTIAMWVSGITQGLMLRALNPDGSLVYPTFVESLLAILPMYWMRLIGGSLYLVGMVLMAFNLAKTMAAGRLQTVTVEVVRRRPAPELPWRALVFSPPIVLIAVVFALAVAGVVTNMFAGPLFLISALVVAFLGTLALQSAKRNGAPDFHRLLEGRALIFVTLTARLSTPSSRYCLCTTLPHKNPCAHLNAAQNRVETLMTQPKLDEPQPNDAERIIHEVDGIQECDNKLPNWWLNILYLSIAFSALYIYHYHQGGFSDLPSVEVRKLNDEAEAAEAKKTGVVTSGALLAMSRDSARLTEGRKLFEETCALCHRSGNIGPNLTDSSWLHGGRPEQIFKTIAKGVPDKGMKAWQTELGSERVQSVTAYVLTLKSSNAANGKAPQGVVESNE
jgi:cytochrome c oxidase cbb3-type subunit I/II